MSGSGAATDFSHAMPPEASAGKNFSTLKPRAASAIASETVAQPGSTGTAASASAAASSGGVPGLTRYFAPAAMAAAMSRHARHGADADDAIRHLARRSP